jgi:hypothetical protein
LMQALGCGITLCQGEGGSLFSLHPNDSNDIAASSPGKSERDLLSSAEGSGTKGSLKLKRNRLREAVVSY